MQHDAVLNNQIRTIDNLITGLAIFQAAIDSMKDHPECAATVQYHQSIVDSIIGRLNKSTHLSEDYWTSSAVAAIKNVIQSGRVRTLQEAITLAGEQNTPASVRFLN